MCGCENITEQVKECPYLNWFYSLFGVQGEQMLAKIENVIGVIKGAEKPDWCV